MTDMPSLKHLESLQDAYYEASKVCELVENNWNEGLVPHADVQLEMDVVDAARQRLYEARDARLCSGEAISLAEIRGMPTILIPRKSRPGSWSQIGKTIDASLDKLGYKTKGIGRFPVTLSWLLWDEWSHYSWLTYQDWLGDGTPLALLGGSEWYLSQDEEEPTCKYTKGNLTILVNDSKGTRVSLTAQVDGGDPVDYFTIYSSLEGGYHVRIDTDLITDRRLHHVYDYILPALCLSGGDPTDVLTSLDPENLKRRSGGKLPDMPFLRKGLEFFET